MIKDGYFIRQDMIIRKNGSLQPCLFLERHFLQSLWKLEKSLNLDFRFGAKRKNCIWRKENPHILNLLTKLSKLSWASFEIFPMSKKPWDDCYGPNFLAIFIVAVFLRWRNSVNHKKFPPLPQLWTFFTQLWAMTKEWMNKAKGLKCMSQKGKSNWMPDYMLRNGQSGALYFEGTGSRPLGLYR